MNTLWWGVWVGNCCQKLLIFFLGWTLTKTFPTSLSVSHFKISLEMISSLLVLLFIMKLEMNRLESSSSWNIKMKYTTNGFNLSWCSWSDEDSIKHTQFQVYCSSNYLLRNFNTHKKQSVSHQRDSLLSNSKLCVKML